MTKHIKHFVALGGPFLGAVALQHAVMIDGTFDPIDKFFTESDMITMMRSFPVGRYLQPQGNWQDGLDLPFLFIRDEIYIKVSIGEFQIYDCLESDFRPVNNENLDYSKVFGYLDYSKIRVQLKHRSKVGLCSQPLEFQKNNQFHESVTFAVRSKWARNDAKLEILLTNPSGGCGGTQVICSHELAVDTSGQRQHTEWVELQSGHSRCGPTVGPTVGKIQIRLDILHSDMLASWCEVQMTMYVFQYKLTLSVDAGAGR